MLMLFVLCVLVRGIFYISWLRFFGLFFSFFKFCSSVKLCEIVSLFLYGKQQFMSLNFSRREHSTQPGFIWAGTFGFPIPNLQRFEDWRVVNHPAAVFVLRLEQLDLNGYCIDIGRPKITIKHNAQLSKANG